MILQRRARAKRFESYRQVPQSHPRHRSSPRMAAPHSLPAYTIRTGWGRLIDHCGTTPESQSHRHRETIHQIHFLDVLLWNPTRNMITFTKLLCDHSWKTIAFDLVRYYYKEHLNFAFLLYNIVTNNLSYIALFELSLVSAGLVIYPPDP